LEEGNLQIHAPGFNGNQPYNRSRSGTTASSPTADHYRMMASIHQEIGHRIQ
jgi:hypothetical protein